MPCEQIRVLELAAQMKKKQQREKARKVIKEQARKMGWLLIEKPTDTFKAYKQNGDEIEIQILKDGIIKTVTDKISMANHVNAEAFLLNIARDLGGKWKIRHKHGKGGHLHTHEISA